MALPSVCGTIKSGLDFTCSSAPSKYFQQVVIINRSDIAEYTVNTSETGETCNKNVQFTLKPGKVGYRFSLPENGSAVSGGYDVSRNDFGFSTFLHRVNLALTDATEAEKCNIEGMVKGSFVAAIQRGEIVEIYGIQNGLSAADFTSDPQANSGFVQISLQSLEGSLEPNVPLVYKSEVPGQEVEDFDSNFAPTI